MAVTVTHSTPADGTFSAEGAAAWSAEHTVTGLPLSPVEVEVDFGTTPVYDAEFTITDTNITSSSIVSAQESGKVATGRVSGDSRWDSISCSVIPATGSASLYCIAIPGPVVGRRTVRYQVSN